MWTAVVCGALANTLIQFFNVKAASIDKAEVSFVAPLQAMTPGLITGLALLLGEYPSRLGIAGIALMSGGSYVLLWEKAPQRWYEYFSPLKRILLILRLGRLSQAERNKTIVVCLALGAAATGTFGALFDGLYTRRAVTTQGLVLACMSLVCFLTVIYVVWYLIRPDAKIGQTFRGALRRVIFIPIVVMGVCWVLHVLAIWPAYNEMFIAYITTLKRFTVLFSVVLGSFIFKEEDFQKRFLATILIIAGALLIATDDLPAKLAVKISGIGL